MRKQFCIVLVFCMVFVLSACDSDKKDDTSLEANASSITDSADETVTVGEKHAVLNVDVKSASPKAFKTDRPVDASKENISIILVIGQSNSTTIIGYPSEIKYYNEGNTDIVPEIPTPCAPGTVYSSKVQSAITTLDSSCDMSKLADPANVATTLGGFSPSFGATWNAITGTKVVFVQAGVGDTGMHEWVPNPTEYFCICSNRGKSELYSKAVTAFKTTYDALKSNYNIAYTGYLWNQGEHDESYYAKDGTTINTAKIYYDAYKSMHDSLMSDLDLDFGVISVVRSHTNGTTPEGDKTLTIARTAQYRLCNNIENLYMGSTISETCTREMMEPRQPIHYSQKTFNQMGAEMANNLYSSLGLSQNQSVYGGLEIYAHNGVKIASVSADGKVDGNNLTWKNTGGEILIKLSSLGTAYTFDYSLTVDGADASECIDEFGKIDWNKLQRVFKKTEISVVCNVN